MDMQFCPLCSGSSGNAIFVQYGETRILIDAGKTGKNIIESLESIGVAPETLSAILVTHEHADHMKGVGILSRKFDLPVYATAGTWEGMVSKGIGKIAPQNRVEIQPETDFYLGSMNIFPFATPHDACEPVGYRVFGGGLSFSLATDLGKFTKNVCRAIAGSSLVLLESNYDPQMLAENPHYTSYLKRRIAGAHGHLSNDDCAGALLQLLEQDVHHVVLGHLSGENNTPELALATSSEALLQQGVDLGTEMTLDLALRDTVGSVFTLRA